MEDDFSSLKEMKYSGRVIVLGRTLEDDLFVGYTLTGRKPSSQARKLVYDESSNVIRTEVTDKQELERGRAALLIYPAMAFVPKYKMLIASNGAQTKVLYSGAETWPGRMPDNLVRCLRESYFEYDEKDGEWIDITTFEPDAPHYTPRISAAMNDHIGSFAIIKKDELGKKRFEISNFALQMGEAKILTTYEGGNEEPLKPVENIREASVYSKNAEDIAWNLYESIKGGEKASDNFRVGVAVMLLKKDELEVKILNRSSLNY